MIIEIDSDTDKILKRKSAIKEILKLNLPYGYHFRFDSSGYLTILRGSWWMFPYIVASMYRLQHDDLIKINFSDYDEYLNLFDCLNDSPTKFIIQIREDYY